MIIRQAKTTDRPEIARLLTGVINHGGYTALSLENMDAYVVSKVEDYARDTSFIVAEDDGILGFQYLTCYGGNAAHVADIATFSDINRRKGGIGRALMNATELRCLQKGYRKITARIRGDNDNGLPFYEKMGFRRVGVFERHSLIEGKYVDQVLMEKHLRA